MTRGDVYLADLNPTRGAEQAGIRPVVLVQRDMLARYNPSMQILDPTIRDRVGEVARRLLVPYL